VGRRTTWGPSRGLVFAAVVGLHGLAIMLMVALRTPARHSTSTDFLSTWIILPQTRPTGSSIPQRPTVANDASPVAPVEPLIPPLPDISFPSNAGPGIDWVAEARRAAAEVTGAPTIRGFGGRPKAESRQEPPRPSSLHEAGEQYRIEDGTWIVWVSDRCYIVSDVPPLGMPELLARSNPTRTVCQGDSGPRSDLFKELPAYKKYHAQ
jgi:hypothetical protein